jgi:hypothetical protein
MREESANKSDTQQPLTPDDPDGCTAGCTSPAGNAPEQPTSPLVSALLALLNQLPPADRAVLTRVLTTPHTEAKGDG